MLTKSFKPDGRDDEAMEKARVEAQAWVSKTKTDNENSGEEGVAEAAPGQGADDSA